jgi:hypothetical protein
VVFFPTKNTCTYTYNKTPVIQKKYFKFLWLSPQIFGLSNIVFFRSASKSSTVSFNLIELVPLFQFVNLLVYIFVCNRLFGSPISIVSCFIICFLISGQFVTIPFLYIFHFDP